MRAGEVLDVPSERTGPPAHGGELTGDVGDGADGPDRPDRPAAGATPETETETEQRRLHETLLASVPASLLRSSVDRLLGPLRDYDARHNAELMPTLRSFLSCDGSWSACASLMYVHVNTVRYRIGRIEALTGRDLSVLADRVDFFLALRGA